MLQHQIQSIGNAQLWRTLTISLLALSLAGCASWFKKEPEVSVSTTPVEKTPLAIELPQPLSVRAPQWRVITPENAEQIFKELKDKNQELVLIALTPDGYQQLSLTFAEIRKLLDSQRQIIIQYKNYYEPAK